MNNFETPEDKNKPSNCVSYHDDVCFDDQEHDKQDQG